MLRQCVKDWRDDFIMWRETPMYAVTFLLVAFIVGSLYVITSSMAHDPPEADDDGGEGLHPMPPTVSGPSGSVRYRDESVDDAETVLA